MKGSPGSPWWIVRRTGPREVVTSCRGSLSGHWELNWCLMLFRGNYGTQMSRTNLCLCNVDRWGRGKTELGAARRGEADWVPKQMLAAVGTEREGHWGWWRRQGSEPEPHCWRAYISKQRAMISKLPFHTMTQCWFSLMCFLNQLGADDVKAFPGFVIRPANVSRFMTSQWKSNVLCRLG